MKLAMRLGDKSGSLPPDADPREMGAEVIELATRRAYPSVSQRKTSSEAIALFAGIAVVISVGLATFWGLQNTRMKVAIRPASVPSRPLTPLPLSRSEFQQTAPVAVAGAQGSPRPTAAAVPEASRISPIARYTSTRSASPTVIFDAGALTGTTAIPAPPSQAASNGSAGGGATDFASRIGGVGGGPAKAARAFDPASTVTQGTMIPAVLETAINTDVPGYVRAIVSQDVRSYDGRSVLVPRSSRLIGQYQSGVQAGQKRAYVIWTRLIRPDGVSVALASPATAFDGSGGLPGSVNTHFFQRFGSAMLLSVIGGVTAVASAGTSLVLGGGQSAAATALQQNGSISPTVRVRMGEPIRVFIARDLDFSQAPRVQ